MRCPRQSLAVAVSLALILSVAGCRARERFTPHELAPARTPPLLIDLPAGYNLDRREGVGFEVFYIQRAGDARGQPPKDGMGIYLGHAPSFSPPRDARTRSGTVAGRKITWYAWQDEGADRKVLRMQTLVPELFADQKDKAGGVAGLQVHIFLWAPEQKQLDVLREAAETLRRK
jgi:hypothetical protein